MDYTGLAKVGSDFDTFGVSFWALERITKKNGRFETLMIFFQIWTIFLNRGYDILHID